MGVMACGAIILNAESKVRRQAGGHARGAIPQQSLPVLCKTYSPYKIT